MGLGVFLSEELLKNAAAIIETTEPNELTLISLSDKSSASAALSRNPSDLMVLEKITFNGVTYYVGLSKE